ncbi:hypothetical protein GCM10025872_12560 [Barrientosiimonas endolithica]|uniref:DUF58 domain-containing protein n=1 Tax=Barrientosiimonas endolithica TaxID=1535208 RepID=A0ABM8HA41_9MICO|nr:transglutaminaseTgpA domain-containing protein [Barrientosiimonas endolithica]BDZ57599.1 hypothetical protein GCM10025872_12560 [Barrientosiimonas endolithica]
MRGRHRLGPIALQQQDPFGLTHVDLMVRSESEVVVLPRVVPLGAGQPAGSGMGIEGETPQMVALHGEDDVSIRAYRDGDDLRKVHWPATAHRGELMVRQEDRPARRSAVLLLDSRESGHSPGSYSGTFEWAVSAVASVATHLGRFGYTLHLATRETLAAGELDTDLDPASVLEQLAVAERGSDEEHERLVQAAQDLTERTGGLVAVVTSVDDLSMPTLAALRRPGTGAQAMVIDPDAFQQGAAEVGEVTLGHQALLHRAGWRAVPVGGQTSIPEAWQLLTASGRPGCSRDDPRPGRARTPRRARHARGQLAAHHPARRRQLGAAGPAAAAPAGRDRHGRALRRLAHLGHRDRAGRHRRARGAGPPRRRHARPDRLGRAAVRGQRPAARRARDAHDVLRARAAVAGRAVRAEPDPASGRRRRRRARRRATHARGRGLPLLGIFLFSTSNSGEALNPVYFLALAVVWLVLLLQQGMNQVSTWSSTEAFARTPERQEDRLGLGAFSATARWMGLVTLVIALALPAVIPHLPPRYLADGLAQRTGSSDVASVGFTDTLDLSTDLNSDNQTPILTYATTDSNPPPLKVLTLSSYAGGQWVREDPRAR